MAMLNNQRVITIDNNYTFKYWNVMNCSNITLAFQALLGKVKGLLPKAAGFKAQFDAAVWCGPVPSWKIWKAIHLWIDSSIATSPNIIGKTSNKRNHSEHLWTSSNFKVCISLSHSLSLILYTQICIYICIVTYIYIYIYINLIKLSQFLSLWGAMTVQVQ